MKKYILVVLCLAIAFSGCSKKEGGDVSIEAGICSKQINKSIYAEEDIERIEDAMKFRTVDFSEIQEKFEIECMRETFQGSYITLLIENNKKAFLFFDTQLNLKEVMITSGFLSKKDFDFVKDLETHYSEIKVVDENIISYPVSAVFLSGHIVTDGFIIITYDRVYDDVLIGDPVVKSVEFISNEDIENNSDNFYVKLAPYILSIDKM